jgi:hypothetical protein
MTLLCVTEKSDLVDLVRFERTPSTFAESRSDSTELQVQSLAETAGVEPAHAIALRLSKPLPCQLGDASENWRKGQDLNLQATCAR